MAAFALLRFSSPLGCLDETCVYFYSCCLRKRGQMPVTISTDYGQEQLNFQVGSFDYPPCPSTLCRKGILPRMLVIQRSPTVFRRSHFLRHLRVTSNLQFIYETIFVYLQIFSKANRDFTFSTTVFTSFETILVLSFMLIQY